MPGLQVPALSILALAIILVTSIQLYLVGRRFTRRFVSLSGRMPPLTWMFRRSADPELERHRRLALGLLPLELLGFALYLLGA